MDKFSTYNGDTRYLENVRYYFYTLRNFFSKEEAKWINMYAVKLRPAEKSKGENSYFLYNASNKKYEEISKEELKRFVDNAKDLEIIGDIDNREQIEIEELEL